MKRRLFHLTIKATGETNIMVRLLLFLDNKDLGVSKLTRIGTIFQSL